MSVQQMAGKLLAMAGILGLSACSVTDVHDVGHLNGGGNSGSSFGGTPSSKGGANSATSGDGSGGFSAGTGGANSTSASGSAGKTSSGGAAGTSGSGVSGGGGEIATGAAGAPLGSLPCSLAGADWCNEPTGVDYGLHLALAPDGGVVFVGVTAWPDGGPGRDLFVVKYAATGELVWIQRVGTDKGDEPEGIAIDSTGDITVVGLTYANSFEGYNYTGELLVKLSSSGEVLWTQGVDGPYDEKVLAVATDASDNLITLGTGPEGGYLASYSPDGDVLWKGPVPSFSSTALARLTFDSVNVDAAGEINVWSRRSPVTMAKFSSSGEPLDTFEAPNDGRILVEDPNHNVLAFIIDATSISRVDPRSAAVVWSAALDGDFKTSGNAALDRSDNVFLGGWTVDQTRSASYVVAYSSTGERLWSKPVAIITPRSLVAGTQGDVFIENGTLVAHIVP